MPPNGPAILSSRSIAAPCPSRCSSQSSSATCAGRFPGADHNKPGMFRLADRGTIFFTEIGDLPLTLQVKLLTVLDDGEFFPLGSTRKVAMNARIIAATSHGPEGDGQGGPVP